LQTWTYNPQNRQVRSAFALTYSLRLRSCSRMGAFVISPLPPVLAKTCCAARPLRSTGITPLRHYYGPNRHRLAVSRLPGVAGYTAYPAPTIARWGEDGFSSCSTCPCHRAAPTTPPECPAASVSPRQAMLPSPDTRELGLRSYFLSRPPVGSLSLRPGDSLTIPRMAWSIGFIRFVSSTDAIQVTRLLTSTPVGLSPTEHASLRWSH